MSSQCEKSPSASSKSFLAATSCNLLFLENTGWLSKGYLVWKSWMEVKGGDLVTSTAKLEEDRIERSCHRRKFSATERRRTILLHLQTLLSECRSSPPREGNCCRFWSLVFDCKEGIAHV